MKTVRIIALGMFCSLFQISCNQAQSKSEYEILENGVQNELQVSLIDNTFLKVEWKDTEDQLYRFDDKDTQYGEPLIYATENANAPILITIEKNIDTYTFGIEVFLYDIKRKKLIADFPLNISVIDPNVDKAIREDSPRRPDQYISIFYEGENIKFDFNNDLKFYVDYGSTLKDEKVDGENLSFRYILAEKQLKNESKY